MGESVQNDNGVSHRDTQVWHESLYHIPLKNEKGGGGKVPRNKS